MLFIFLSALILLGGIISFKSGIREELSPSSRLEEFLTAREDADWKAYRRAFQKVTGFFTSFLRRPETETEQPNLWEPIEDHGLTGFYRQVLAEKKTLTVETLKRLEENLQLEIEEKLRQEKSRLQYISGEAIKRREEDCADKLADYRRTIEEKHKARLADLRFRLCLPDLSAEEEQRLTEGIQVEEKRITGEIDVKAEELRAELAAYKEEQKAAVEERLEQYRRQIWAEGMAWLQEEAERLGQD